MSQDHVYSTAKYIQLKQKQKLGNKKMTTHPKLYLFISSMRYKQEQITYREKPRKTGLKLSVTEF